MQKTSEIQGTFRNIDFQEVNNVERMMQELNNTTENETEEKQLSLFE